MKINILFENDEFIIVDKPSGLLTIRDRYDEHKPYLQRELKKKYEEIFVVHRIDKETSGCICFAKNEQSHKYLSELFQNRKVNKKYLALVKGNPSVDQDTITESITEDKSRKGRMMCNEKGKSAVTNYKVLERFASCSLLEVAIETGRTHQIRVHCKHIGNPLLIDKKYGSDEPFLLSKLKGKKYRHARHEEERPLMSRLTLHAQHISFKDVNGNLISAEASLPKDFKAVLNQLRKLSPKK